MNIPKFLDPDFELENCIPTDSDFQKVATCFKDYRDNGVEAELFSTPWAFARSLKNKYKKIRYFMAALLIGYDELADSIKHYLKIEFSKEQMQEIMQYIKEHSYMFINIINKYKYVPTNTESITEATLDPIAQEKKMDAWHNGTRGANVPSMSDAKLKMNYDICVRKGYSYEARELKREAANRGLSWGKQQVQIVKPTNVTFDPMDFQPADGQYILDHANNLNDIVKNCMSGQDPYKEFIKTLILAMCLKQTALVENIKNLLSGSVVATDLKNQISSILKNNPALTQRLSDIVAALNVKIEGLQEDIEKHDELNPKLFQDNKLKPEVKEKLEQIVEEFLSRLQDDEISIDVQDIILVGSNCSYNYTKDSDLDVHILANNIEAPENLYEKIYSAYRSIFNKNIEIDFYGIPVEIYVQTENTPMNSNGIYSVLNDSWIKEPVQEDIPEVDQEAFDKEFKVWEDRYNNIIADEDLDEAANSWAICVEPDGDSDWEYFTSAKQARGTFNQIIDDVKANPNNYSEDYTVQLWHNDEIVCQFSTDPDYNELNEDLSNVSAAMSALVKDEWEAIENYQTAVKTLKDAGDFDSVINILNDIADEEKVHSGELQACLDEINDNASEKISDGIAEAEEMLANPVKNSAEKYTEDLNENIENKQLDEIEQFIEDIYELRKASIAAEGEYSIGNLIFKECRNKGYLDNLKDLKNKIIGKELSLESLEEMVQGRISEQDRYKYRQELSQIAFNQAIINDNGLFHIYNIKESNVNSIVNRIRALDYIDWVQKTAGRFDFSKVGIPGSLQPRIYEVYGQIKL